MTTLIIDDELSCCNTLQMMLASHPDLQVTGICRDGVEGLSAISSEHPDIVFLDIEMPRMNGFEMLEQLNEINFHLIFTTSYDQYALKAFRFSAVDYLLKPIDKDELARALEKVGRSQNTAASQIELLLEKIRQPNTLNKIALPTMGGLQMVPVGSIVFAEANDNYTILHLKEKGKLLVSNTLKEIGETLSDHAFWRVHRGYLVNLNEVEKYVKGEGGYLVMSDGSTVDVSRTKKEALLRKLLPGKS